MSAGNLRKRVELLEKILKPQLEAATLTAAPAPGPSAAAELKLLWLRCKSNLTPEEKVELERFNALYPPDPNPKTPEEVMREIVDDHLKKIEAERYRR
jgi:hypothetical protein